MKCKLSLLIILLFSFQNFVAQELPYETNVTDSIKVSTMDIKNQKAAEIARLENQLKQDKSALIVREGLEKDRKKAENKLKKEQRQVEKGQNKLLKDQKKFDNKQKKLTSAEKSLAKNQNKMAQATRNLDKMEAKFEKFKSRGKLTAVNIEKWNVKISKQRLKISRFQEDIYNSQDKLDKLQQ